MAVSESFKEPCIRIVSSYREMVNQSRNKEVVRVRLCSILSSSGQDLAFLLVKGFIKGFKSLTSPTHATQRHQQIYSNKHRVE